MFDETGLRMMELAGKGYCCSQIMVLLALDEAGKDNPGLIAAASGLCNGLGDCSGPCGVYTGACLVMGWHAGKGADTEVADDRLPLLLESLRDWFASTTSQYGGTACCDILEGECGQPDSAKCGGLLSGTYAQVRIILSDNGFELSEGRDQG